MTAHWKTASRYVLLMAFALVSLQGGCSCNPDDPLDLTGPDGDDVDVLQLSIYKCGTDFQSVEHPTSSQVIFAGSGGIVAGMDPGTGSFVPVYTGVANDLTTIRVMGESATIVGKGLTPADPGIILGLAGDEYTWRIDSHPAGGGFTDFSSFSAVTDRAEVLDMGDGTWKLIFEDPVGTTFNGVRSITSHILAVGDDGRIFRNENPNDFSVWRNESVLGGPDFQDIDAEEDAGEPLGHLFYAVGEREIWRRSGGNWERVFDSASGDLIEIRRQANPPGYWVAGTNGTILHHDGSSWNEYYVGRDAAFRAISYSGEYACGDDGTIFHKGITDNWVDLGYANTSPWNDIDGLSSGEVYAANGDTLQWWNGSVWTPLSLGVDELVSLHVVATNNIWAVARSQDGNDSFAMQWDGGAFRTQYHSSLDPINSIWCDEAGDTVLAVADNGSVFRFGGVSWEWLTADAAGRHLYDLDGSSAHDLFAVGQAGLILHFDGNTWTEMPSGVAHTLRAISGPVAVGDNGVVTHFTGAAWKNEDSGTKMGLNAVCYLADNNIWAAGDGGQVIHFDGSGWRAYERTLYTVDLKAVWGGAPKDIWFGGETGYLLRSRP